MRGGFGRYIGPGPGEPRGARESLNGALAIDLFHFFMFSTQILSLFTGLQSSLVPHCKFLLEALYIKSTTISSKAPTSYTLTRIHCFNVN